MSERVTVLAIEGEKVTVEATLDRCSGCNSILCGARGRTFTARNAASLPLTVGDEVEVTAPAAGTLAAAALLFLVPLAGSVLCYPGAGLLGAMTEALRTLIGFGGLAAGVGLSVFVSGRHQETNGPVISAVSSGPDGD